jgi:hypothetical protein
MIISSKIPCQLIIVPSIHYANEFVSRIICTLPNIDKVLQVMFVVYVH